MNWKAILLLVAIASLIGDALAVEANMYIFAVSDNGEGIPAVLVVDVTPGSGKISLTLNTIVGEDTQESIRNAILAAVREANKTFQDYDYSITINSGAKYVAGPSAGLPIALAVYAALNGVDVPDWVSATGTINEYGEVGPVGGIYEKVKAAHQVDVNLFLIPKGERYVEIPSTEETEPGVVVPSTQRIDIVSYAKENYNMDVYEVSTLHEAVLIVFKGVKPEQEINAPQTPVPELNFVPPTAPTHYSKRFREVVEKLLEELNNELSSDCIKSPKWKDIVTSGKSYYEQAKIALENGYYYTAGNYAFLGATMVGAAVLLCEHPSMADPNSLAVQEYVNTIKERLDSLSLRAEKYVLTTENYEWVGGARERILRAEGVLNDTYTNAMELLRALKSAEYWLMSAEEMLNIADDLNKGEELNHLRTFARDEIIFVEDLLYANNLSRSDYARRRLDIAKEAFSRGWYFAAFAEAALAKGILIAWNTEDDKLRSAVEKALRETEEYKGLWAELYRNHGIYYKEAADVYRSRGLFEKEKEMLRTSLQMIEAAKEFSYLASSLVVTKVRIVKEEATIPPGILGILLVLLASALLLAAIFSSRGHEYHRYLRKIPKEKREEAKEIIRRLEILSEARRRLLPLLKKDYEGIIEGEVKKLDRKISTLRRKLERLAEHEPQQRSSRPSRGKRR